MPCEMSAPLARAFTYLAASLGEGEKAAVRWKRERCVHVVDEACMCDSRRGCRAVVAL